MLILIEEGEFSSAIVGRFEQTIKVSDNNNIAAEKAKNVVILFFIINRKFLSKIIFIIITCKKGNARKRVDCTNFYH